MCLTATGNGGRGLEGRVETFLCKTGETASEVLGPVLNLPV